MNEDEQLTATIAAALDHFDRVDFGRWRTRTEHGPVVGPLTTTQVAAAVLRRIRSGHMMLSAALTDDHRRLYVNSPSFHHGVDQLFDHIIPAYLEGLAVRARQADSDHLARVAVASASPVRPRDLTGLRDANLDPES